MPPCIYAHPAGQPLLSSRALLNAGSLSCPIPEVPYCPRQINRRWAAPERHRRMASSKVLEMSWKVASCLCFPSDSCCTSVGLAIDVCPEAYDKERLFCSCASIAAIRLLSKSISMCRAHSGFVPCWCSWKCPDSNTSLRSFWESFIVPVAVRFLGRPGENGCVR